jgi:Holliday junction DNA helicase RuvA
VIGKLTGIVDLVGADHVILDVGGVGYHVTCSSTTLARLSAGTHASLAIETKVSDEAIRLYGFLTMEERDWFRLLQTVQGVGARVALSVLSALKINELERAILLGDKTAVGRAQGVGPKLATRMVIELKDKMPAVSMQRGREDAGLPSRALSGAVSDASAALVKLGYSQGAAAEAVAKAGLKLGDDAALDTLIRESLRQLARIA